MLLRLRVHDHRAELEDPELSPVAPDPDLAEEHRAPGVQPDRDRDAAAISGPATSSPTDVATRSKPRLSMREERDSPNGRTPSIVIPSTSSNSTADPTTSSIRGSTLTCAPAAFARRINSATSADSVVGAMMMRWMCSSSTMRRNPAASIRSMLSSPHGRVATTEARAWLPASLLRIQSARSRSATTRHRWTLTACPAMHRAATRAATTVANMVSHSTPITGPSRPVPNTSGWRIATPSAHSPVSWRRSGASSRVEGASRLWS